MPTPRISPCDWLALYANESLSSAHTTMSGAFNPSELDRRFHAQLSEFADWYRPRHNPTLPVGVDIQRRPVQGDVNAVRMDGHPFGGTVQHLVAQSLNQLSAIFRDFLDETLGPRRRP